MLTQTLPICEHLQKPELFLKQAMFSVLQLKQLKIAQEYQGIFFFFLDVSARCFNGCRELNLAAVPTSSPLTAFL